MAVERVKEYTLDLGGLINTRIGNFVNNQKRIRAKQEAEFERRILEEGLSYRSQLNYRNSQLEEEKNKTYPNTIYIEDLKKDISNLKRFVKYERLRDNYLENYTRFQEGKITIDNLIAFSERQLEGETDPTLRKEMSDNLSAARIKKVSIENSILENRFTLAQKDKSIDLINQVINEIENVRSEAGRVGDREAVTAMNIKLQVLKKEKQQITVSNKIHDFELSIIREGLTASQKLDLLNNTIAKADEESSITVNNTQWNSEIEYWTAIRDQYISGIGSGEFKSFFDEFNDEIESNVKKMQLMNKWGYIPSSSIDMIDKNYKNLMQRAEFQPYVNLAENYRLGSLSSVIDKTANAIMDEAEFYGEYDKGFQSLRNIQAKFGIDMASYIGKLYYNQITSYPAKKTALMKTAEILAEQRGTTPEEEFEKLIVSPVEEEAPAIPEVKEDKKVEKVEPPTPTPAPAPVPTPPTPTPPTPTPPTPTAAPATTPTTKKTYIHNQKSYAYGTGPLAAYYPAAPTLTPTPTPTPTSAPTGYTGPSIIDYLKSVGKQSSFSYRGQLAKQYGVTDYTGTKIQNTKLLKSLRGF